MTDFIERYWRDATPEDAIKEPPMVARFRDKDSDEWLDNFVCGVDTEKKYWFSKSNGMPQTFWWKCQVYDAPDPGEGWRLIDVDKETKQEGDEYLGLSGVWRKADMNPFCPRDTYRRRITPAVTYVPFTWEDREQLRGRWIKESDNVEIQVTAFHCNSEGVFYSEGRSAKVLVERWRFLDTGKPVGKEVQA